MLLYSALFCCLHLCEEGIFSGQNLSNRRTLLGALPIDLETRLAGDAGTPIAAGEGAMAAAYAQLAQGLVKGGMA